LKEQGAVEEDCGCGDICFWIFELFNPSWGLKGELNPKIKLDLNDSFINKYNPHIF